VNELPPFEVFVLAAGDSSRFGAADKLRATVNGHTLLAWTCTIAEAAARSPVNIVVRPGQSVGPWHAIDAPRAAEGIEYTLDAALRSCDDGTAAVILLADDPIAALALPDLVASTMSEPGTLVCIDRDGAPHPIWFPASLTGSSSPPATGSGAARDLVRTAAKRIPTVAPDPVDVDRPEDLRRLGERLVATGLSTAVSV
jgi:molybdenum cofactor cytidylyltransferase